MSVNKPLQLLADARWETNMQDPFALLRVIACVFVPLRGALGAHTMRNIVAFLIISVSSFAVAADSGWDVSTYDNEWATLYDTHQGKLSLTDAVNSVPKRVWLRNFRIFLSEHDHLLQKEIHEFLSSNYPELHAAALNSAGNMHNPKVIALREPVKEAILATSLAKEINAALASRCEQLATTSYEKFIIWKKNGKPTYSAMVWLSTAKCT